MKKVSTAAAKQSRNISQPTLTIGLDLGDRNSWYCVLDEAGQIQLEQQGVLATLRFLFASQAAIKHPTNGLPDSAEFTMRFNEYRSARSMAPQHPATAPDKRWLLWRMFFRRRCLNKWVLTIWECRISRRKRRKAFRQLPFLASRYSSFF